MVKRSGVLGLLIVNKPGGMTSHDVVDRVRRVFGIRRVGHAGTLDPLATGVLLVLVGEATKRSGELAGKDKEYEVRLELGWTTDSLDSDGEVVRRLPVDSSKVLRVGREDVEAVLEGLRGRVMQRVPCYSAVKLGGKKLYELARKGKKVARPKREVEVYELEVVGFRKGDRGKYPEVRLLARVSTGTYTRWLVEETGRRLGLPAVQTGLVRKRVGEFGIEESVDLEELEGSDNPEGFLRES